MRCIRDIRYENYYINLTYKKTYSLQCAKFNKLISDFPRFSKEPEKPIDVLVLRPFLGFHSQGMRTIEADRIAIKLWGKHPLMLVHELTHCFFPSKSRSFHEGLADYFQTIHEDASKRRNVVDFTKKLLALYKLDNPAVLKRLWTDSQNCDNTRNNLMLITRYVNLLFVAYLLERVGVDAYFRMHYGESSEMGMDTLFSDFFHSLYDPAVRVPRRLVRLKAKHTAVSREWSVFAEYGLPEQGNPMRFLKSVLLSKAQNREAIGIYRKELLLYNAWLRVGHNK